MHLERVEISGFRGIRRLSLSLEALTTLIGENTWGKSSLLDALSIALPPDGNLYHFLLQDFHVNYAVSQPQTQHLQIVLSFITTEKNEPKSGRYRRLKPLWQPAARGFSRIIYRISGTREQDRITTVHHFLDQDGEPLKLHHSEKLAQELSSLHPVLRLRDSRHFEDSTNGNNHSRNARIEKRIDNTCRRLLATPGHVNKGEIKSSLNAMNSLVEHYFSFKSRSKKSRCLRGTVWFTLLPHQKKPSFNILKKPKIVRVVCY